MQKRKTLRSVRKSRIAASARTGRTACTAFLKKLCFGMLCLLMTAGIFGTYHMLHSDTAVVYADEHLSELKYKVIEIREGDSLWRIAKENMNPGFHDINEYIDEVITCNQLSSDRINAGCYLMIPYYEILED